MAVNERHVEAPVEAVWDVLADAWSYADWVVGAHAIRNVEGEWPVPGSRFHHTQGRPPLVKIDDTTLALDVQAPHRLLLEVRTRPLLVARVQFTLAGQGSGTLVRMEERPVGGLLGRLRTPVLNGLIGLRNMETLRRLADVTVSRGPARTHPAYAA